MSRLLGVSKATALSQAHVCVIGLGGVGSWTVEALARSGVGALTLVDLDEICVSNVNRQLHTTEETIGRFKAEVMAERVNQIHPSCQVDAIVDFFSVKTAEGILARRPQLVVDAIDNHRMKCLLLVHCRQQGIPAIVSGASGGLSDPTQVTISDINKARNDTLLRRVRKTLRQKHDFPRGRKPWGFSAVWSTEFPMFPQEDGSVCERPEEGVAPARLDCADGYGAASYLTGTFGFVLAAEAVRQITAPKDDAN